MYQPNKSILLVLFGYTFLMKVLPYVLMHFGMNIQADDIYPWTFTPMFAVGLFGVALFRDLKIGFLLPLGAFLLGDVVIGVLAAMKFGIAEGIAFAVYPSQIVNSLALLLSFGLGLLIRQLRNVGTIVFASILAPVLFYLVSNFGVWALDAIIGYPQTLAGLQQSYFAGLPFLKNSLISTLAYSALLFSPLGISQLQKNVVVAKAAPVPGKSSNRDDRFSPQLISSAETRDESESRVTPDVGQRSESSGSA